MNFLVYHPAGKEKQRELRKRVAAVHSDAVKRYVERIPCPSEQKKELMDRLIEEWQKKGTA